jgi:hypothetical protein
MGAGSMSMVGLINAITMSVLERTREIRVLRCIDARVGATEKTRTLRTGLRTDLTGSACT